MQQKACIGISLVLIALVAAGTWWLGQLDLSPLAVYGVEPDALHVSSGFYIFGLPGLVGCVLLADRTQSVPARDKCKWIMGSVLLFPILTLILLLRIFRDRSTRHRE